MWENGRRDFAPDVITAGRGRFDRCLRCFSARRPVGAGPPGNQPGPVPGPGPAPGPIAANAPGPVATQPSSCPDIEVIFARGTDDTPGLGTPGSAFVSALRPLVGGRTVSSYAVNYPASYDFLAAADGASDAENRVAMMSQQCPSTKLVLGGYSQGAAVIDMLAGRPAAGQQDRRGRFGGSAAREPAIQHRRGGRVRQPRNEVQQSAHQFGIRR